MSDTVRIGIIGAKPDQGWASVSHIPAIAATPGLQLAAVAARSQDSADAAARGFGVAKAYGSTDDLIADPDIDLVAVVTSVPGHHDLILASLAAGKHVITEWPVGISTAQTQKILDAARAAGVRTAVGLQARMNPAVGHAMHLLRTGALGRVVDATVYSATAAFGAVIAAGDVYLENPETAMNLVTIQASHTMDLAAVMVGGLDSLSALTTVRYPQVAVAEEDRTVERTIADHLLVSARTTAGGALSVQVVGGRPADDAPFRMDITGTDGELSLTGGGARGFQAGRLTLTVDGKTVDVDPLGTGGLPDTAVNVSQLYAALRDDIRDASATAPDFAHALALSHLMDDLLDSAREGRTVTPSASWS